MRSTLFVLGLFVTPVALGQDRIPTKPDGDPSTTDPDVKPEAPDVDVPNLVDDVKTYAGVGSDTAYGEQGVVELGGSFGLSAAENSFGISADPFIGYFLIDNIELGATLGVRHSSVGGENANQFALLVEPSFHVPINDGMHYFIGLGIGGALVDTSVTDSDIGVAFAPRTGLQFLIGRSGLLNVGARYSIVLSDVDAQVGVNGGETVLAFDNTFDVQAGYTIMF
jgi:opacity protein-like surface antigen